jgi:hypothetical protein
LKIFLRPFISRWMARVDFVHLCIRYNPIRYSTKHCTLRLAPRSTRWPGREAIRATWLVHTPVADQRGRLWLPRARTSNQAKQSPRAAPRRANPSPDSENATPARSPRLRRRLRSVPWPPCAAAGCCWWQARSRARQCGRGGRDSAAKALQDPGNGRLTQRLH